MAKRGEKSAAIREYMENHPTAKAREVIDALAKQRIKVTPTQVYGLLSKSNGKSPKRAASNGHAADQPLLSVKAFVIASGGIEKARAAIDTLASLQLPQ